MKTLYIIGNGLDIAHKMKTSYQDFFKYYLTIQTNDNDIMVMKKDIHSHRYETWADLEIGMGFYASQCADKDMFLKCIFDLKKNLKEYLKKESEKIVEYKLFSNSSFVNLGSFLEPEPRSRYERYVLQMNNPSNIIDIITLNYTSTLETLFGFKGDTLNISPAVKLRSIHHIHGTLNDMMVMGVNDTNQIHNVSLNTDLDVVEEFVKPEFNDACMNNKNTICEALIREADMIVLYGTSLGKSDDKWWKLIGRRMGLDHYPFLVYLPFDEKKNQLAEPNHLRRWTMSYVRDVHEKFDIQIDEKILASRMCIALNKRLFEITMASSRPIVNR